MFVSSDKVVSVFSVLQWFLDKIAGHHAKKMKKEMDKQESALKAMEEAKTAALARIADMKKLEGLHLEEGRKAVDLVRKLKTL